jgi:hypothetical protein
MPRSYEQLKAKMLQDPEWAKAHKARELELQRIRLRDPVKKARLREQQRKWRDKQRYLPAKFILPPKKSEALEFTQQTGNFSCAFE